jgi:HEAT repeat protein
MSDISELPFQTLIDALLDEDTPFNPRYLYRFSDLEGKELTLFLKAWPRLPLWRRQALMEDLLELGKADDLLSFENIARNTIIDEDPQVRLMAVQILWEFEERDLVPGYLQLLQSDPVTEVRAASASGLGRYVYLGELDRLPAEMRGEIEDHLLHVFLHDPAVLVQCRALESVGFSSRSEIASLIESAFNSNDHDLMASALIAMGRSMDSHWETSILSMLNNTQPSLRAEAARAAGELEIEEAVSTLIELTTDSEEYVRSAAIWSLSEIGGERARHSLEKLLQETDDDLEADFLESALDNIAFTNGMRPFSLVDFPEDNPEDELLEMLISQETSMESDWDGIINANQNVDDGEYLDDALYDDDDEGFQD